MNRVTAKAVYFHLTWSCSVARRIGGRWQSLSSSASTTRTRGLERLYPDLQMFVESGTCVRRKTGEQKGVRFHVFIRSSLRREVLDRHSYSSGSAGLVGGKRGRRWLFIFIGIRLFTQSERNVRKWRTCEGFGAPSPRGSWPWDRVSPLLGSAKETTVLRDVNDVFVYHFESISNLVLSVNGQKCSPLLGSDKFNT